MELLFHIQTPLGILLKSEMSYADMISILEELHKYVPVVSSTTQTNVLVDGEVEECTVIDDKFHRLLFGGDQLTAARARGAQRVRSNSERPLHNLRDLNQFVKTGMQKEFYYGYVHYYVYRNLCNT